MEVFVENRKAWHDYNIIDRYEVGIVLSGTEVKSIRAKMVNLSGSFVQVLKGELWLVGSSISHYDNGSWTNHKMIHDRKLLCHAKEIRDIKMKTEAKGMTAVPLKLYSKNGRIKLEIGLAKGKNVADKRQTLKDKAVRRDLERQSRY